MWVNGWIFSKRRDAFIVKSPVIKKFLTKIWDLQKMYPHLGVESANVTTNDVAYSYDAILLNIPDIIDADVERELTCFVRMFEKAEDEQRKMEEEEKRVEMERLDTAKKKNDVVQAVISRVHDSKVECPE